MAMFSLSMGAGWPDSPAVAGRGRRAGPARASRLSGIRERTAASRKPLWNNTPIMKPLIRICALVILLGPLHSSAQEAAVIVTNPSDLSRVSETVAVPWGNLPRLDPARTAVFEGDQEIPCQSMVLDGGGAELLFQSSFKPHEAKTFRVGTVPSRKSFPSPVDARFVLPRADVGWESDRIAFRIYGSVLAGDVDNGIDVWTKRVRYPIVAKWYKANEGRTSGKDTYHEDHGEGADFFSVGRSLGAGSAGIWRGGKLHQPGMFTSYTILADGPIRAAFRVAYEKGTIDGKPFREVKTISIDAGSNLNRIEVTYSGAGDTITFLAGLVKRKGVVSTAGPDTRWISLWGPTNEDPENGSLGLGVVFVHPDSRGVVDDSTHFGLLGTALNNRPVVYYAGTGWTRSGDFSSASDWNASLARAALRLDAPLKVRVR